MTSAQADGTQVSVNISELVGNQSVNGFTLAVQRGPIAVAGVESIRLLSANLSRLGHKLHANKAIALATELLSLTEKGKISDKDYIVALKKVNEPYGKWLKDANKNEMRDLFGIAEKINRVTELLKTELVSAVRIFPEQSNLDHAVDAFLTYLEKQNGDLADLAQNMRWQHDLVTNIKMMKNIEGTDQLAELSQEFDLGYAARKLTAKDFPKFLEKSLPVLRKINAGFKLGLDNILDNIKENLGDPRALQKHHRKFLLKLEELRL
jgi:hypothetical protein